MASLVEEAKTKMITHTFIILSFFISNLSYVYAYGYHECSSLWSCGNATQIGYPFWGSGRPQYCGLPAFNLLCPTDFDSDNYPILQINDAHISFQVSAITISDEGIMTIKLLQRHPYSSCPTDFYTSMYDDYNLSFSSNVDMATLFYDCSASAGINASNSDSLICSNINTPSITSYYLRNQSTQHMLYLDANEHCEFFQVPFFKDEMIKVRSRNETLDTALAKGFEMYFDYVACTKCQSSGGACASTDDSFLCFCKDAAPSTDVCPNSEKVKVRLIIGLGSLGVGVAVLLVAVFGYIHTRKRRHFPLFSKTRGAQHQNIEAFLKVYGSLAPKRYTYANIRKMTNNFKDKLGEGGYGTVYEGKMSDGRLVAVKLLNQVKGNGEDFINEVASISRTNHVNIVALLGFCFEGSKRSLIYEFMSNGSLERFTYRGASYTSLSWEKVFDIALGIARGLDYLHRGCNARILHFDIKPHNILLDDEFHPKISDFGLARLCPQHESSVSMLEARGTIGYIAPEVFCRNFGGASHKSDVYSYGMMILDLVCGRTNTSAEARHSSQIYFPEWIYNRLEHGEQVIPGILIGEEKKLQRKMILVSLWCIQTYPSNRPSMSSVIEMLNVCLESIQLPPKPYASSPP